MPTTIAGATTLPLVVAPGRVVIDGKGFGHGVGLAQDGAFWMGKSGKNVNQILAHFFPNTTLGKRSGVVRVPVAAVGSMTLTMPSGGSAGGVQVPAGGAVRVVAGAGVVSVNLVGARAATTTSEDAPAGDATPSNATPSNATPSNATPTSAALAPLTIAPAEQASAPVSKSAFDETSAGTEQFGQPIPEVSATVPDLSSTVPLVPEQAPIPTSAVPPGPDGAASLATTTVVVEGVAEDDDPVDTIQVKPGAVAVNAPVVRITAAKGGVIVLGSKRYRGTMELAARSQGMKVVNELDVEQYLRGMAEVLDPRWPAAALQSQAVVARTYALRMMGTRGEVCPTQACQVYVGAQAEFPEMDAAVAATAGKVVLYKGELANTFYSASGGGSIAEPSEVFGPGPTIPYLKAGTYPTGDPKAWRVELSLVELGRRVGYPGTLYDVQVSKVGSSGRAVEVTFFGSSGARAMTGPVFDRILGLRSNNFRLLVGRTPTAGTTLPWTGTVPILDGAGLGADGSDGSPLDFQSGLFNEAEPRSSTSSTAASESTATSASAVDATVLATSQPPSPATADAADMETTIGPDTSGDADVGSRNDATVELAVGSSDEESSSLPGWLGPVAVGLGLLGVLGAAGRWALRPEPHRTATLPNTPARPKRTADESDEA